MDDLPLLWWLVLVPFVLCWVGGVVSFSYMAYYLVKTMARYRADRQWGKFVGFSFLVPAFFTEEGNVYRVQLVKWIGRFLFFLASGALIGLAVKFATGH